MALFMLTLMHVRQRYKSFMIYVISDTYFSVIYEAIEKFIVKQQPQESRIFILLCFTIRN